MSRQRITNVDLGPNLNHLKVSNAGVITTSSRTFLLRAAAVTSSDQSIQKQKLTVATSS